VISTMFNLQSSCKTFGRGVLETLYEVRGLGMLPFQTPLPPQAEYSNPCRHRSPNKYCLHASSSAKRCSYFISATLVFGSRPTPHIEQAGG